MEYQQIKISCPIHPNFLISHGCTEVFCNSNALFCSACLIDNTQHTQMHQKSIIPIGNFITGFFDLIKSIEQNIKPYEEIENQRKDHILQSNKLLMEQKEYLNSELRELQNSFNNLINQIRIQAYSELEGHDKLLQGQYDLMKNCLQKSEIPKIKINHHAELAHKLQSLGNSNPSQLFPYIMDLRQSMQNLYDPINSNTLRTLENISQFIYSLKKRTEKGPLGLVATNIDAIKQIEMDSQNRVVSYFRDEKYFQGNTGLLQKTNKNAVQAIQPITDDFSTTRNPNEMFAIKTKTQNQISQAPFAKSDNQNTIFLKSTQRTQLPKQKNCLHPNASFFAATRFKLQYEQSCSADIALSTLCVISLSSELFLTGGRDGAVTLYQIDQNQMIEKRVSFLDQLATSIWSLALLRNKNISYSEGQYKFAAGSEDGQVFIWVFDIDSKALFENQSPIRILSTPNQSDIITCVLDFEDGNHLLSGDSIGTIQLWDYGDGTMMNKQNIHKQQINSLSLYNQSQNFAVGSYDGIVSLWNIYQKGGYNQNHQNVEIACLKIIQNHSYIYSISCVMDTYILIVDHNKKFKLIDTQNFRVVQESISEQFSELVMEVLVIESQQSNQASPILICFTKQECYLIDALTFKIIQKFDANELFNNHIGLTMCSNNKAVFLLQQQSRNLGIKFVLIDQNNKTSKVASVFNLSYVQNI